MTGPNEHFDTERPTRLVEDLSALYRTDASVPAQIDQDILAAASRHFAARRRVRYALRWVAGVAAAAAVIFAVLVVDPAIRSDRQIRRTSSALTRQDIDGSGRVDILDAFALARYLEADHPPNKQWDINADGAVDRADVDTIALAAVRLTKGTYP